jgi:selenocysteine lyase/cysteine desulfurase
MTPIDIDRVRADTPACAEVIHLNNAGAALPPQVVVDEMVDYLRLEAELGGYETVDRERARLERVYDAGARLLNCEPDELALTSNASEAWWRAFTSIRLEAGDRILTDRAEYISNALGLLQARHRGVEVVVVPDDDHGQVDVEAMQAMADERVKLIAATHIPTNSGLVNPAAAIGAVARSIGAIYLLDACQSAGQMPLDVEALQCDFLSLTGRKFLRGPRGTGLLYANAATLERLDPPIFIDGHSAEWHSVTGYAPLPTARRFELFETSFAGKAGLGIAIDYALALGLDSIRERVVDLAERLRLLLRSIDGVTVHDHGIERCGIVTFDVAGHQAATVRSAALAAGINVSETAASPWQVASGAPRPTLVRASVHYYNTDDELERLAALVTELG